MFRSSKNIGLIAEFFYEKYSHHAFWKILLVTVLGGIMFFILMAILFSLS